MASHAGWAAPIDEVNCAKVGVTDCEQVPGLRMSSLVTLFSAFVVYLVKIAQVSECLSLTRGDCESRFLLHALVAARRCIVPSKATLSYSPYWSPMDVAFATRREGSCGVGAWLPFFPIISSPSTHVTIHAITLVKCK